MGPFDHHLVVVGLHFGGSNRFCDFSWGIYGLFFSCRARDEWAAHYIRFSKP